MKPQHSDSIHNAASHYPLNFHPSYFNTINKPPLENERISAHLRENGQNVTQNYKQQI